MENVLQAFFGFIGKGWKVGVPLLFAGGLFVLVSEFFPSVGKTVQTFSPYATIAMIAGGATILGSVVTGLIELIRTKIGNRCFVSRGRKEDREQARLNLQTLTREEGAMLRAFLQSGRTRFEISGGFFQPGESLINKGLLKVVSPAGFQTFVCDLQEDLVKHRDEILKNTNW